MSVGKTVAVTALIMRAVCVIQVCVPIFEHLENHDSLLYIFLCKLNN